eukprot:jgi/Galph1/1229/GphlegSOOS_G6025.1
MESAIEESYFDVVVVGTGLPESIMAAWFASLGRTVLHLDSRPFYGGDWATLTGDKFERLFSSHLLSQNGISTKAEDSSALEELKQRVCGLDTFQSFMDIELLPVEQVPSFSDLQQVGNNATCDAPIVEHTFLDITPEVICGHGQLVETLIQTQAASYLEFRPVDKIFFSIDRSFVQIPTSRNDIFRSTCLSHVEKRTFMKFLKSCAKYQSSLSQYEGRDGGLLSAGQVVDLMDSAELEQLEQWCESKDTLDHWLHRLGFTEQLKNYIYAILTLRGESWSSSCIRRAIEKISDYCCAVQRFPTSSGFLYPKYGTSDLSEAFCRRCAVNGGTYILNRGVSHLICDKMSGNRVIGIVTTAGDVVRCAVIIASSELFLHKYADTTNDNLVQVETNTRGTWKLWIMLKQPMLLPHQSIELFVHCISSSRDSEATAEDASLRIVKGMQVEQYLDAATRSYLLYLSSENYTEGKEAITSVLKSLWSQQQDGLEERVEFSDSLDTLQALKQLPHIHKAYMAFCHNRSHDIPLENFYSCSVKKDLNGVEQSWDQLVELYNSICTKMNWIHETTNSRSG